KVWLSRALAVISTAIVLSGPDWREFCLVVFASPACSRPVLTRVVLMHLFGFRRTVGLLGVACVLAFTSVVADAQTVVNPSVVEFSPSASHNAVNPDGTPVVTDYTLAVFVPGQTTPVVTTSLGKLNPDPDGMIRASLSTSVTSALTPNVVYEARVSAVGPGGTGQSSPSNSFTFQAACAPAISPTGQAAPAA